MIFIFILIFKKSFNLATIRRLMWKFVSVDLIQKGKKKSRLQQENKKTICGNRLFLLFCSVFLFVFLSFSGSSYLIEI